MLTVGPPAKGKQERGAEEGPKAEVQPQASRKEHILGERNNLDRTSREDGPGRSTLTRGAVSARGAGAGRPDLVGHLVSARMTLKGERQFRQGRQQQASAPASGAHTLAIRIHSSHPCYATLQIRHSGRRCQVRMEASPGLHAANS